jgi:hypothetical protein
MSFDDKSKSNMDDIKYVEEAEETEPANADRVAEEKALVRKIDISFLRWKHDPNRLTICVAN